MSLYKVQDYHGGPHIRVRTMAEEHAWADDRLRNGVVVVGTGKIQGEFVEVKHKQGLVFIKRRNLKPQALHKAFTVQSAWGEDNIRVRTKPEESAWGDDRISNGDVVISTGAQYEEFVEVEHMGYLVYIKAAHLQPFASQISDVQQSSHCGPHAQGVDLPKVPPMPVVDALWPRGPLPNTCWVIPGKLLGGGYPGGSKEPDHTKRINAILNEGVSTFVCLMPHEQLRGQRNPGFRFNDYMGTATHLAGKPLTFLQAPIPDGSTATDSLARAAAETIISELKQGSICYVHCWGGNGRTGTILSIVLARLYGVDPQLAVSHFQKAHATRTYITNKFPESSRQLQQALRLGAEAQGTGEGASDRLALLTNW
jgi:hypothetical protein